MEKIITTLALLLLCSTASAGRINEIFGDGILGTTWGQSLEEVQKVYPKGKKVKYGDIVQLEVKDGREVLGVERSKKDKLGFVFNPDGKLNGVAVYYPGKTDSFGNLLARLEELFGPYEKKESTAGFVLVWPIDNGISISLTMLSAGFGIDTVFSVGRAIQNNKDDRTSLGLD